MEHDWDARERGLSGEDDLDPEPTLRICKYCREGGLHWEQLDEGWRLLHANGKLHTCKPVEAVRRHSGPYSDLLEVRSATGTAFTHAKRAKQ